MEKKKVEIEKVNRIAKMYHYNKKGFSNVKISRLLGIHRNMIISHFGVREYPFRVHPFANRILHIFESNSRFKTTNSQFKSTF